MRITTPIRKAAPSQKPDWWQPSEIDATANSQDYGEPPRKQLRWRAWILSFFAMAYAIAMLALGGATFERLYAPSPYHRLQADALLKGQLHIGNSLQQIRHDLAWHDGQVNHVWGLGVGLWLTPFEFSWRLAGQTWFPDRIALGVAFGLLAWYSGSMGWRLGSVSQRPAFALGSVWLIVLCPAVWTLNHGGRLIYEETSLYACLVSLAILVATVRVACFDELRDFWICAILAALSALVRPTHLVYGFAGMLVCSTVIWTRRRRLKSIVIGCSAFAAGLAFLALTNWSRFGSPAEFGHRLTATPGVIVYMTRIDNPMKNATFGQASRELLAALFLARNIEQIRGSDQSAPGQAPHERWRDPYLTTYDLTWAAVCVLGVCGAVTRFLLTLRGRAEFGRLLARPTSSLVWGLFVWGGLSIVALAVFYLKLPTFSYRYLLDFAPGFTAFAMLTWTWIALWRGWIALPALAVWLGYETLSARIIPGQNPLRDRQSAVKVLAAVEGKPITEFGGRYSSPADPHQTGIAYNGYGWKEGSHIAGHIVILAVDHPRFVELAVEPRLTIGREPVRPDVYRAMIGNCFLPIREIEMRTNVLHVKFAVPDSIQARDGNELLFLCFSSSYNILDRNSERLLHLVQWR